MIFDCAATVSYLSKSVPLLPGEVATAGTPPGVGLGQEPRPPYLKPGGVDRLGSEKLGEQQRICVAWEKGR